MLSDIPLFEISWNEQDVNNVVESVTRGGWWANGPFIDEFEEKLEDYLGVKHAICVNSGTSALVTALKAAGIGPGDEVIVPGFTFIATANAVELVGATPVFADSEVTTYAMSPADAEAKITEDTAAIMPVHVYGAAARVEQFRAIADEHDLLFFEDAAQALGTKRDGQFVGTFGDAATMSFCQSKIVATGEGGAIFTDDDELAEDARHLRSHGRVSSNYFESTGSGEYAEIGWNFRMPDIVAALGASQMDRVEDLISGRREASHRLFEQIEDIDEVTPHTGFDSDRHVYMSCGVSFDDSIDRDAVIDTLEEHAVSAKVYWKPPVHLTGTYRDKYGFEEGYLPEAERAAQQTVCLPMHPDLTEAESRRIAEALREAIESQV